jgi:hypothetical protein
MRGKYNKRQVSEKKSSKVKLCTGPVNVVTKAFLATVSNNSGANMH